MNASDNQLVGFYRCMRLIRRFEERVVELVNGTRIAGTPGYSGEGLLAVSTPASSDTLARLKALSTSTWSSSMTRKLRLTGVMK